MYKYTLHVIFFLLITFQSCESEYSSICADYYLPISRCKEATQAYFKAIPNDKIKRDSCLAPGIASRSTNYMDISKEEQKVFFNENFDQKKVDFIIIKYRKDNKSYYLLSSFEKYCNKYQKLNCGESHSFMQSQYGFSYFKNSCNIQGLELQEFFENDESYSLTLYFTEVVKNIKSTSE